ncbi:unnamed protein product [Penicillium pancosmium]
MHVRTPDQRGPNHARPDIVKRAQRQERIVKGQWNLTRRQFAKQVLIDVSPQFLNEDSVREYRVLKTLRQIPSTLVDHPRVSELNSSGRTFWVKSPRLYWVPLLLRVKAQDLDFDSLLELQRALQDYTKVLYKKGVAYEVKPEYLYPIKMPHGHWKLYLGGWMEAAFSSDEAQAQSEEWQKREAVQISEITRIFAEARATIQSQT